MSDEPVIELRGLEKRFGPRRALAGVDLTVNDRQIFGVVGADGAGKTTLLRTLAGLLEVRAERARVLGADLTGDVSTLKSQVGYVPQSFSLHRNLSIIENLRFTARIHRLSRAAFEARAAELMAQTGLASFADRPAGALSGGMRQKLGIVNALLPEPRLLLLDEPTAGVDVMARAELWSTLQSARTGALVVISTSYVDEAAVCDTLAYLSQGRVAAVGTPADLRTSTPLDLYRAWGESPGTIARAARGLPYVHGARPVGRHVRIEVHRNRSPDRATVLRELSNLSGAPVRFAERLEADMESTLLALATAS